MVYGPPHRPLTRLNPAMPPRRVDEREERTCLHQSAGVRAALRPREQPYRERRGRGSHPGLPLPRVAATNRKTAGPAPPAVGQRARPQGTADRAISASSILLRRLPNEPETPKSPKFGDSRPCRVRLPPNFGIRVSPRCHFGAAVRRPVAVVHRRTGQAERRLIGTNGGSVP